MNIGKMEVKNRFVRSATIENMAKETGEVTDEFIKLFSTFAKGEIGLIIPGYMYVHPSGKAFKYQTGIYNNNLISGLKKVVDAVHKENGKIAFQIVHAGMQTFEGLIGTLPAGPSGEIFNPISLRYSKEMTEEDIQDTIQAFEDAARRVIETGADAIQLHAAHGYLINQFLSPFYNRRKDKWGGSEENQFRYLKELIVKIKKILPNDMPLLVKLNSNDYTPDEGVTPPLAAKYAEWLVNLGINAIEISCGSSNFSIFNMCRGDVPVQEIIQFMPDSLVAIAEQVFQEMVGQYNIEEAYNLNAAKVIKPIMGNIPLILVGGLRSKVMMEEIIGQNYADFISMSRPFIREPFLVKNFKEGKQDKAACISCNRCLAAVPNDFPVRCYTKKFPSEKRPTIYLP
jgi:2,4-dienoyl-CoA reductase-like NADH-dependent reductase (Old Yellow Enzyme family)